MILEHTSIMRPYTQEVAEYCAPFVCEDCDLDEFFSKDAFLYEKELLGKSYAWISLEDPSKIIGLVTLANDSIKARHIAGSARNRLQRSITNAKRGMNYPAVLIGRLAVATEYRGKGFNIGSQIIDFLKSWFCTKDNKTGCRFIVVDAYNNDRTLHFYVRNGFKLLYRTEEEEREFLELAPGSRLETRFMFFDLKTQPTGL